MIPKFGSICHIFTNRAKSITFLHLKFYFLGKCKQKNIASESAKSDQNGKKRRFKDEHRHYTSRSWNRYVLYQAIGFCLTSFFSNLWSFSSDLSCFRGHMTKFTESTIWEMKSEFTLVRWIAPNIGVFFSGNMQVEQRDWSSMRRLSLRRRVIKFMSSPLTTINLDASRKLSLVSDDFSLNFRKQLHKL